MIERDLALGLLGHAACRRCHNSGGWHVAMQGIQKVNDSVSGSALLKMNPLFVSAVK
jgi:hypothetical protein